MTNEIFKQRHRSRSRQTQAPDQTHVGLPIRGSTPEPPKIPPAPELLSQTELYVNLTRSASGASRPLSGEALISLAYLNFRFVKRPLHPPGRANLG